MAVPPGRIQVTVTLPQADGDVVEWTAAAPPDYRHAFAGSGLPFQSKSAALDRTPNRGTLAGAGGQVKTVLMWYPNSYRDPRGYIVPPSIELTWRSNGREMSAIKQIGPAVRHRALSHHPARCATKAMFYDGTHELPVRTQEDVLRSGGYGAGPSYDAMSGASDFWGLRPRL